MARHPRLWLRRLRTLHPRPSVIQLFMPGGPSQVDTFDYKPQIARHAGQRPKIVDRKTLRNTKNGLMPSPFGFKQYGQTGTWVSDIFPHTGQCADDICFIHSMHTNIPEHAGAMMMFNLGHLQPSRPSLGSWLCYGLGTENQELPGLVAMSPRAQPRGKSAHWGNSFLPGAYSGVYANIASMKPDAILGDLKNPHCPHRTTATGQFAGSVESPRPRAAGAGPETRVQHPGDGDGLPHAVHRAG